MYIQIYSIFQSSPQNIRDSECYNGLYLVVTFVLVVPMFTLYYFDHSLFKGTVKQKENFTFIKKYGACIDTTRTVSPRI